VSYAWYDVLGNVGVAVILAAYIGVQIDRLDARSVAYSVLNAIGAGLITVSLCFDFNLSAFVIELAWMLISLYGIASRLATIRSPSATRLRQR
jgi:hypothetical protein